MSETVRKVKGAAKRTGTAAALRSASRQAVRGARAGLIHALSTQIAGDDPTMLALVRKRVTDVLESPMGDVLVGATLSVLLVPASEFNTDGEPENAAAKVSEELRTAALANAADKALDAATGALGLLLGLGGVTDLMAQVRVAVETVEAAEAEPVEVAKPARQTKGVRA